PRRPDRLPFPTRRSSDLYVWATGAAQPVGAQLLVQVPRRGVQPAREAPLALRFCRLTLCPPRHRKAEGLPEVVLWAVQVREVEPDRKSTRLNSSHQIISY